MYDTFVEDFLMTHIIFLPVPKLCTILVNYYKLLENVTTLDIHPEIPINNKKKVVKFIKEWCDIAKDAFYEDPRIIQLINDMLALLKADAKAEPKLRDELKVIEMIYESNPYLSEMNVLKRVKGLWRNGSRDVAEGIRKPIRPQDENIFKIYFADHTYSTVRLNIEASARQIINLVVDKVGLVNDPDKTK